VKTLVVSLLLFCSLSLAAQSLSEGATVGLQVEPNPLNGTFVYDFELCCGIPQGAGGFLGNGFAYVSGNFTAFYKYPAAKTGYWFSGTIDTWYTRQAISPYCTV
jgi:hypothetical protein